MQNLISKLPEKYQWSVHNLIGHPISEIFHILGLEKLSKQIHDITLPPSKASLLKKVVMNAK